MTPWAAVTAVVLSPLAAPSLNHTAILHLFLGYMSLLQHQAQVRATRFEASLPLEVRELFLGRFLALALSVWLPAASGSLAILALCPGYRDMAVIPVEVAVISTFFLVTLQSLRPTQLASPRWVWGVLYVPFWALSWLAVATGGLEAMALVSGLATAALFVRTWFALPPGFQLAPAARKGAVLTGSGALPAVTREPLPWYAAVRTVFAWQYFFFLPQFFVGSWTGRWLLTCFFAAIMWQQSRQRMRWLWNLPVDPATLLPVFLVPQFLVMVAGYYARFHSGRKPVPVPEPRVMIVELAAFAALVLLVILCSVLFDWRRLRRIPVAVRAAGLGAVVVIPVVLGILPPLFQSWAVNPLHDALVRFAAVLPASAWLVLILALISLAILYAVTALVFRQAEYTGKTRSRVWGVDTWTGWQST